MGSPLRLHPSIPQVLPLSAIAVVAVLAILCQGQLQYFLVPLLVAGMAVSAGRHGVSLGVTAAGATIALVAAFTVAASFFSPTLALLCFAALSAAVITIGKLHTARQRAENALRERDLRIQLLSLQIPGGLWSTDTDLNITSCFGSQSDLLSGPLGSNLRDWFGDDEHSHTAIEAHRRACLGESSHYELPWRGHTFQCQVDPLRDASGRIIGVIGAGVDITDRMRAEQALREARHQLEQANRAKDHFLATLSHELRTPLTPVLALSGCLEERPDFPPDVRDDLATIRRNVELEARLIDDLLDLTRVSAGKLLIDLKPVDLHRVLSHTLDVCRHASRFPRVQVSLELQATRTVVRGDAARLQQVFWNLVKNALKFTPDGGSIRIRTLNPAPEKITILVTDTGIGIAPDMLPHIFEPFEQGGNHVTQKFGGLGLGLAITRAIVTAHAGTLSACSDGIGTGACFAVELATSSEAAAPSACDLPDAPAAATPARELTGLSILLVDDHEDTVRVMARLLVNRGARVAVAHTVAAATPLLTDTRPDLLISDIGLPDGSGRDLMQLAAARNIPGIALSGFGADADQRQSLDAGFAAHLTKPVPLIQLRRTIAQVLGRHADRSSTPAAG